MIRDFIIVVGTVSITCLFITAVSAQDTGSPAPAAQQAAETWITDSALRADIRFLADDLLEGRQPGTRGDLLTQAYIISQFQLAGLEPARSYARQSVDRKSPPSGDGSYARQSVDHQSPPSGDGSYEEKNWLQPVPLIGITTDVPPRLTFQSGDQSLQLQRHDDYVLVSGLPQERSVIDDAEIVFVGYGIQAPEYDWDDFKDDDVRGKVLLVMNNDPAGDPDLFSGNRRLYYGRWDYKYAKAAELGAAGMFVIHTAPSAGYPFQVVQTSWTGEQMALDGVSAGRLPIEGWLSEQASRQLVQLAGKDLDQLRAAAESRDFQPVPLDTTVSISTTNHVRRRSTANVLGLLPGRDSQLNGQWVVVTAHHDHLGIAETRDKRGDNIYNGAVDNASGVAAMLSIARAMHDLPADRRPKRSVLFAAVGAEEQGLLGSKYLAANPPIPPGRLAAVINIDGANTLGPTKDVVVIGRGKSDLDEIVEKYALWQDRIVVGDQFPDRGYYYRSDQFSLAKIGVPGIYLHSGTRVVGKPEGWGEQRLREWTEKIYHQTSDEYDPNWNLEGAVQDARLLFNVTNEIANQPNLPAWTPGDEFEAARKAVLQ